jgi:site-specific recombinase XerD
MVPVFKNAARWIADNLPGIRDNLTPGQIQELTKHVVAAKLATELSSAADIAAIDYPAEKKAFLDAARSEHTRTAYASALNRLEAFSFRLTGQTLLSLTPGHADDFIYAERAEGRSPASIRLTVSAASAFFTFLERRHSTIKNPFRGTRARPAKKAVRTTVIPDSEDVNTILAELPPFEAAAVAVLAFRGLRAGALPEMMLRGNRFTSRSKGKDIAGELPDNALEAIRRAGLTDRPFAGITANTLEQRILRAVKALHEAGKIAAAYSAHDFRHYFAVTEYRKDKDIHRLSALLGHAGIAVTETYLKTIGEYSA